MSYIVKCVNCGQELESEEDYSGQEATCPACGKPFIVPERGGGDTPTSTSAEADEASQEEQQHQEQFRRIVARVRLGYYEEALDYIHENRCTDEEVLALKFEILSREGESRYKDIKPMFDKCIEIIVSKDPNGEDPHTFVALNRINKLLAKGSTLLGQYNYNRSMANQEAAAQATLETLDAASKMAEQAGMAPEDAETCIIRGTAKRILRDCDGAEVEFRAALQYGTDDSHAYSGLARTSLEREKHEGLNFFSGLAGEEEEEEKEVRLTGYASWRKARLEQAADYAQKALDAEPDWDKTNWEARMVLAETRMRMGWLAQSRLSRFFTRRGLKELEFDWNGCVGLLLDAIKIAPHELSLYEMVVSALKRMKDDMININGDIARAIAWALHSPEVGGEPTLWYYAGNIASFRPSNVGDIFDTKILKMLEAIDNQHKTGSVE